MAGPVVRKTTGRGALTTLTREKGASVASHAVQISGTRGRTNLVHGGWSCATRNSPVDSTNTLSARTRWSKPPRFRPRTVPGVSRAPLVKRVKFDSTAAFAAADKAAKKALIGFDSLDYELRNKELSQDPVWLVRLRGAGGATAGELIISAESGAVLRKRYETARQPAPSSNLATTGQRTGSVGQPTF